MPFRSEKQRRFMHARHPEIARRWEAEKKGKAVDKAESDLVVLKAYASVGALRPAARALHADVLRQSFLSRGTPAGNALAVRAKRVGQLAERRRLVAARAAATSTDARLRAIGKSAGFLVPVEKKYVGQAARAAGKGISVTGYKLEQVGRDVKPWHRRRVALARGVNATGRRMNEGGLALERRFPR